MPHIHTEPGQHDLTVSAFIIRTDGDEPRVLFHMHRKIGLLLHFGGHVELDESPWHALAHELVEESGYELGQLKILQPQIAVRGPLTGAVLHPTPVAFLTVPYKAGSDHFHTDAVFAFVTDQNPKHKIDEKESQDIRSFSAAELRALPSTEVVENVREMALEVLATILPSWQQMPTNYWTI